MILKAIIIGAIGTLVETSEFQRRSFNMAFAKFGIDWHWTKDEYKKMLSTPGGKNRISEYAAKQDVALTPEEIDYIHSEKSRFFQETIREKGLKPRPGIEELIMNAKREEIKLVFASDTIIENIRAIKDALGNSLNFDVFDLITDGSMVDRRRPYPDLYNVVLDKLNLLNHEVIAIEDTINNVKAPISAGITTIALPGDYVVHQDFSDASAIAEKEQLCDINWLRTFQPTFEVEVTN